jgi:hypothetical protein
MIADELRTRLRASPFVPFSIVTGGGTKVHVHHHDYAWVLPTGGSLYVQDEHGKVHLIYLDQVAELVHEEPAHEPVGPA